MLKKTIFIIDKDIKYIEKIKTKIKTSSLFKVIGESTEVEEALRKIKVLGGVDFLIIDLNIKGEKDGKRSLSSLPPHAPEDIDE